MIGGVVATELLAQVFQVAAYGEVPGAFIANAAGSALAGGDQAALEAAFGILWWAHMLLVAAFLCYLPFSKHLHIATAIPNIALRKIRPRGELPAMDLEAEDATFGIRTVADLSWKDLLDGFTCTECGRCQEACPAWNTGKPLNPKTFIMGIRHEAVDAEAGFPLIPNSPSVRAIAPALDDRLGSDALARPLVDTAIPFDAVWDCLTCGACVEACPVTIEHVDKIVGIRRNLVLEESRFPQELTSAFKGMESVANPWGQPPSARLDWAKGLPFEVRTVAAVAGGRRAGLARGPLLGRLRGGVRRPQPARGAGRGDLPRRRRRLVRRARAGGVVHRRPGAAHGQRVRVPDPGRPERRDAQPLQDGGADDRHRVPALLQHDRQRVRPAGRVVHDPAPQPVPVRAGRGRAACELGADGLPGKTVTYHDSCYLARYNGVIAQPREVLGAIPGSSCARWPTAAGRRSAAGPAGAGCGWRRSRGTRVNAARTLQVLDTGAETVATACPFCMVMLRDGLNDAGRGLGAEDQVTAQDISELLAAAIVPLGGREVPEGRRLPVV